MPERDPQDQTPQNQTGADSSDTNSRETWNGESGQVMSTDSGPAGEDGAATTEDGGPAVEGGKLPGNHDDFDGELDEGIHPVPGADKKHHPAHAMNKGETKHLGV